MNYRATWEDVENIVMDLRDNLKACEDENEFEMYDYSRDIDTFRDFVFDEINCGEVTVNKEYIVKGYAMHKADVKALLGGEEKDIKALYADIEAAIIKAGKAGLTPFAISSLIKMDFTSSDVIKGILSEC